MNSSCDTNPWDDIDNKGLTVFLLCAPFTIVFNAAVLAIAFKYVKVYERLDQLIVVNMTLANILYGLVYLFVSPYVHNLPKPICILYYVVGWTCTAASMLFLLHLNFYKFVTLFVPYHSDRLVSEKKVITQIAAVWLLVILYSIILSSQLTFTSTDPCYECLVKPEPFMYATMMLAFFVCPLTVSFIISICIFVLAQKKSRSPTGSIIVGEQQKKFFKRILFVFSYTVFSVLTFLPYRIYDAFVIMCSLGQEETLTFHDSLDVSAVSTKILDSLELISEYGGNLMKQKDDCSNDDVLDALRSLLPFGCLINPLITIITQKCYRNGVKKYCRDFIKYVNCCSGSNNNE